MRMAALQAVAQESAVGLDGLWWWSRSRLQGVLGWSDSVMATVERYRASQGESPDLELRGEVVLPMDGDWPICLNRLERLPLALHREGDQTLLQTLGQRRAVAVVGTRSASSHGLQMAEQLGRALAEAGWPVLSGLAEGIDAAVHRGCLSAGGSPVAVLGTPLNRTYPRHHGALQKAVGSQGLLLSELRSGQRLQPGHFAARNRLLVAMASAVVVVECPERSGALISARLATQLECPVWVIPADAFRWSARGSNRLLQGQASALLTPDELIQALGPGPRPLAEFEHPEAGVLAALGHGATLDELAVTLRRSARSLMPELVALELSGRVVCESGLLWKPSRR